MSQRTLKRILVTGGAGFIGSAFIRYLLAHDASIEKIVNFDLLTYAANLASLASVQEDSRYHFVRGDINNGPLVESLVRTHKIDAIAHFAAETHVDRSITDPRIFYKTNVEGTISLLEVVRRFPQIHFHHVSTDEVYGSIEEGHFTEDSPYRPNSPYAASKAASDHFVKAYANTYNLSTTLSHCTNNFGPFQHEEKFIPLVLKNLQEQKTLPVYGQGINVRNWIYVDDHVEAVWKIMQQGRVGDSYNIGGSLEARNIDLLHILIDHFATLQNTSPSAYHDLITYVQDRPGHDLRYAISSSKIASELGWTPRHPFLEGLKKMMG